MPIKSRKKRIERKTLYGFLFISPWLFGFVFFFGREMIQSLIYSFSEISMTSGYVELEFVFLKNYIKAFTEDADFVRNLTDTLVNMAYQVPVILFFSMFIAYILKENFHGRLFFRAMFFLPVIISSGVVLSIIQNDPMSQLVMTGQNSSNLFQGSSLESLLRDSGISARIVDPLISAVNNIFDLTWKSGIQILIFLSAYQTIPQSVHEAARIEGATEWEFYWKITFPIISPMMFTNLIYTVIDTFTDYSNPIILLISTASKKMDLAYSAAMSWIYFLMVFILIAIVYKIVNRHIFYAVE